MSEIAVIDLETTGIYPRRDRVVEIAAVVIQPDGTVIDEYATLVNPRRDIGPTTLHGIAASDVLQAPEFSEIAGDLVGRLRGVSGVAAHNSRFDLGFMRSEFQRIGYEWPEGLRNICTMIFATQLDDFSGRKLIDCCEGFGVDGPDDAHTALSDARATARLLAACLALAKKTGQEPPWIPEELSFFEWPAIPPKDVACLTRVAARSRRESAPGFLDRAVARLSGYPTKEPANVVAYLELLDRCLEDRRLEEFETEALLQIAEGWELSVESVRRAHRKYLGQLAVAALADGVLTDAEKRDLETVRRLLGEAPGAVEESLDAARRQTESVPTTEADRREELAGRRVCFTGKLFGQVDGETISREQAHLLAAAAGLEVASSVTKKLDLLVVADPDTQSSKANKARKYGTRIMAEPVFWKAIGVEVD